MRSSIEERRIRVAHVVFDLDRGGMETVLVNLLGSLHGTSIESSVLILSGQLGRAAQAAVPFVARLDSERPWRAISLIAPVGIVRWLRRARPEVVHLHSGAWLKPALAARLAGVPSVVFTEHGRQHQRGRVKRLQDVIAARLTDAIVAVSPQMVPAFARDIALQEESLQVIINGVDTARFCPGRPERSLRQLLGLAEGTPMVGTAGRFERVKGYDLLLEAFEHLLREWKGPVRPALVLAGAGSLEQELRSRVAGSSLLSTTVHLLPWRDDPSDLYRSLDLFVLSSRSEGTSLSLLEALSCGTCPLVTAVGGNPFVLGPELAHRLVAPESARAIAEGLARAFSDPDAMRRDALVARARVESTFSVRAMADHYRSLYRSLAT